MITSQLLQKYLAIFTLLSTQLRNMEVLNYSTLRSNLKAVLDSVVDDHETVIITRGEDNAVIISLEEYNSWQETLHLLSTENNRKRLSEAIKRDKKGQFKKHKLISDHEGS